MWRGAGMDHAWCCMSLEQLMTAGIPGALRVVRHQLHDPVCPAAAAGRGVTGRESRARTAGRHVEWRGPMRTL